MRALAFVCVLLTATTVQAGQPFARYEASQRAFERGLAAQQRGAWSEASQAYRRALALDGGFVEARVNLARVRLTQGKLDEAARGADRAVREHGDYPPGHTVRGLVALRRGDLHGAVAALRRAQAESPDDVEVLCALGATMLRLGVIPEARQHLSRALRVDPSCLPCALDLAIAFDRQSDLEHASFWYRRFLDLAESGDPQWVEVRARLAELGSLAEASARAR